MKLPALLVRGLVCPLLVFVFGCSDPCADVDIVEADVAIVGLDSARHYQLRGTFDETVRYAPTTASPEGVEADRYMLVVIADYVVTSPDSFSTCSPGVASVSRASDISVTSDADFVADEVTLTGDSLNGVFGLLGLSTSAFSDDSSFGVGLFDVGQSRRASVDEYVRSADAYGSSTSIVAAMPIIVPITASQLHSFTVTYMMTTGDTFIATTPPIFLRPQSSELRSE